LRRILVLLFLLILLFTSQSSGQEPAYRQVEVFTDNCMKIIQSSNFDEAARSFHYPPNFSPAELEKDRNGVKLGLMELCKIFGTLEGSKLVQRPVIFYQCAVGGGTLRYWQKYPESIQVKYEATFSKEGEGFVIFNVVRIFKKFELRSVAFGIPIATPNAKERMEKIAEHMIYFMKSRSKQPERQERI
jgi:hypothetical protein